MHTFYTYITGPLLWFSIILFFTGSLIRIISLLVLTIKKERFLFSFLSIKYALRSMSHWIVPFWPITTRKRPFLTITGFIFHISLFVAPLFFISHVVLFYEAWNLPWIVMSDRISDIFTLAVIGSCLFFLTRRLFVKDIRYISSVSDFGILAIIVLPFITGFWAYHQLPGYSIMHLIHILSGEILIAIIPFTRLNHMIFGILTRIYMSSEFGGVKTARDW